MDTTVKVFLSTDTGASTLNYAAGGGLLSVLDACLVSGYGQVTLTSLVIASEVATATVNAGHGFAGVGTTYPVIVVEGASPSGLNGEWRIVSIPNSTTFTFSVPGIGDQTATGTITAKRSPAGWTKPYTGTNVAVFRNNSVSGTGAYFRINDTAIYEAKVIGYRSMDSVDTGIDAFPGSANATGTGGVWVKAYTGITSNRAWFVIANSKMAYIGIACDSTYNGYTIVGMGDITSYVANDVYRACVLCLGSSAYTNRANFYALTNYHIDNVNIGYLMREFNGIRAPGYIYPRILNLTSGNGWSGYWGFTYPNGPDNGLVLQYPIFLLNDSYILRGHFPGQVFSQQTLGTNIVANNTPSEVTGVTCIGGRSALAVMLWVGSVSYTGTGFFDMTGPWDN